jgi:hypothetical protein
MEVDYQPPSTSLWSVQKMRQRTKKQHYVPQAALRRFSADGERVFVYDKLLNEVRISNVRDVAQQRYFYDIPHEVIPADLQQTMDRQAIEHTLSELEGDFNTVVGARAKKGYSSQSVQTILEFHYVPTRPNHQPQG